MKQNCCHRKLIGLYSFIRQILFKHVVCAQYQFKKCREPGQAMGIQWWPVPALLEFAVAETDIGYTIMSINLSLKIVTSVTKGITVGSYETIKDDFLGSNI